MARKSTKSAPITVKTLESYEGRMSTLAAITDEFISKNPSETRQRNLAAALRGVKLAREESNEHKELEHLRDLAAQIEADREARSALESGVEFTFENETTEPSGIDN